MEDAAPQTATVTVGRSRAELLIEPCNQRVTVRDYRVAEGELPELSAAVVQHAWRAVPAKIAWLARPSEWQSLLGQGFVLEAVVPRFLEGEKGFFMARFTEEERRRSDRFVSEDRLVDQVRAQADDDEADAAPEAPDAYRIVSWEDVEASALRRFYEGIFASYPTPLTAPGYIERQLEEGRVVGRVALRRGQIASSAAIELDRRQGHAEVTDCGTAEAHRGRGLNRFLVSELEPEGWRRGMRCLFAVARARSFGMNLILYRGDYAFAGRLVKHSHIAGQLEDMNVWFKTDG